MTPSDFLIAVLVSLPYDCTDFLPDRTPESCKASIKKIVKELDLYVISDWNELQDFREEVYYLRRALSRSSGCPPLTDLDEFPSKECLSRLFDFHYHYKEHLRKLQETQKWKYDRIDEVIDEADFYWKPYRKLYEVYSNYYNWQKREALGEFKEMIGEERYYKRSLPPPFPVHLFQNLDK